MSESKPIATPDEGEFDSTGVARLFAEAWRDRRSGWLTLRRAASERRIRFQDGGPISIEGDLEDADFARRLEDAGLIGSADRFKVERMARERECPQASAVLALRLLDPKVLYKAMREVGRDQICECLEWESGRYAWAPPSDEAEPAGKPHPILNLLQAQLPRRWGSARLFQALMPIAECHADVSPRFRRVAAKLGAAGEPARRAIARLDGSVPLGRVLGECAGDPLAASTLWTLFHTGALRMTDGRRAHEPTPEAFEFEVEVIEQQDAAGRARAEADASTAAAAKRKAADADKSEALRREILSLLERLSDLDHYTALGLESDAKPAQIKRAYFGAAKKYHPDTLARLGLAEIRDEAAQVFARIAEAFETLSDATKKAAYDAGGGESAQIDTTRLAQAEKSFRKGEILVKMGNFAGALEYLEPAVELWPEEPAYQAGLAWALYKQPKRDVERALEHFKIAAGQAPENARILYRLGLVLRAAGDDARAGELIARARSIDPSVEE